MIIGDDTQSLIQEENAKVWSIHRRMRIPSSHTTYWCTMHAAPRLPQKQHVIGVRVLKFIGCYNYIFSNFYFVSLD